jgi:hypothetical protein
MLLTLGCCAYITFFLLSKNRDNIMPNSSSHVPAKNIGAMTPLSTPANDFISNSMPFNAQSRDLFSITPAVSPNGPGESTPKGQLPAHLKIVGIVIAHPAQIIIEDSLLNQTYFIDEGNPQAGIKIVKVGKDKMVINYQGQDIDVSVNKD